MVKKESRCNDNGRSQLGTERIPLSVLLFLADGSLELSGNSDEDRNIHRNAFLSIHRLAGSKVQGAQHILLGRMRNVHSRESEGEG